MSRTAPPLGKTRWSRIGATACLVMTAGCASHAATMRDVREALIHDDLEEARARLAEAGRGTDDLLFALEDGLLLHYAGEYELSNSRFSFVEHHIDDLYTKSIFRAALSLVTSDLVLRFEPRGIETFLVNYYGALNYLELGEEAEAWVEWRKLASKLQFSRDAGDAPYIDPPFFNYLVGLGLESDDRGAAYVAFRSAEAGYRRLDVAPPPELVEDLVRLAGELGFSDHLEEYRNHYGRSAAQRAGGPDIDDGAPAPRSAEDEWGEIVLLVEEGLVAPIEEVRAYIPITTTRYERSLERDDETRSDLARVLAGEYAAGEYAHVNKSWRKRKEIAYVLPVAFPVFGLGERAFTDLRMEAGPQTISASPALWVSDVQQGAFEARLIGIYAKTVVRALVKYAAASEIEEEAEEKHGEGVGDLAGILANVVNVATERADTRAWLGLPHRIWLARLKVPPGTHEVVIYYSGDLEPISLGLVEVGAKDRYILNYRVF